MAVCPKCGLPKELCVCETMAKESKKITVIVEKRRYGKFATIIKGMEDSQINMKDIMSKLKSRLACGGTYKNGEIELQGNHRERVKEILIKEGFPEEVIDVK